MADITMCRGEDCPFKENCYRHKAQMGLIQSFFLTPPYKAVTKACNYFWPVEVKDKE